MKLSVGIKLTFLGGMGEVGGNAVLLEDSVFDVRIIIDFGINLQHWNDLDATATDSTVQQLLAKQILPTIKSTTIENLYDGDLGDTNVDGILISHPHRDHYGGLPFLNRQIPVYAGFASKKIILAFAASEGQNASNDFDDLNWHEFRTGEILDIKGLVIVPVHVDHSVPGSYGFIIHSSSGIIVYTGNFRFHGPMKQFTTDFLTEMQTHAIFSKKTGILPTPEERIKVLICEGTKITHGLSRIGEQYPEKNGPVISQKSLFVYFCQIRPD